MNWLSYMLPGPVLYLNNVVMHKNPFVAFHTRSSELPGAHAIGNPGSRYNSVIMNYEDPYLDRYDPAILNNHLRISYHVLILRDPFNWMASRMKARRSGRGFIGSFNCNRPCKKLSDAGAMDIWVQHAREFLGHASRLPNKICISFNRWYVDYSYRRRLAEQMCLPFRDDGREQKSRFGGGSSFRAGECLSRYKDFMREVEYSNLFTDTVLKLSGEIFGEL